MKKLKVTLRIAFVLCAMIVCGLIWSQPKCANAGLDCEIDLFNAFLDANDLYGTTFRSWYLGQPVSCQTVCESQCGHLPTQDQPACEAKCNSACNATRFDAFSDAQDNLMYVASQTCPYNPDECAAARARRDECVAMYNAHMQYPMMKNGEYDQEWLSYVMTEYGSCLLASGVQMCE